jgi:chemotaxis signal transduction protein
MLDLIVFSVGSNRYAMDIENIQRIIQANHLTSIPNAHKYIDGMMSHEESVIKVMSFRKLIGLQTYEQELQALFAKLKIAHKDWVDTLKTSVYTGSTFTKTFNPHMCDLGKWIDGFTSYDDRVSQVLAELVEYHKRLHLTGGEAYELAKADQEKAKSMVDVEINNIYNHTMGAIDTFVKELDTVANSLQKLLIYDSNGKKFAIKVDTIEDIAHVEESEIMSADSQDDGSEFLELDGVLDINGVLINVIKTIKLPS